MHVIAAYEPQSHETFGNFRGLRVKARNDEAFICFRGCFATAPLVMFGCL